MVIPLTQLSANPCSTTVCPICQAAERAAPILHSHLNGSQMYPFLLKPACSKGLSGWLKGITTFSKSEIQYIKFLRLHRLRRKVFRVHLFCQCKPKSPWNFVFHGLFIIFEKGIGNANRTFPCFVKNGPCPVRIASKGKLIDSRVSNIAQFGECLTGGPRACGFKSRRLRQLNRTV